MSRYLQQCLDLILSSWPAFLQSRDAHTQTAACLIVVEVVSRANQRVFCARRVLTWSTIALTGAPSVRYGCKVSQQSSTWWIARIQKLKTFHMCNAARIAHSSARWQCSAQCSAAVPNLHGILSIVCKLCCSELIFCVSLPCCHTQQACLSCVDILSNHLVTKL